MMNNQQIQYMNAKIPMYIINKKGEYISNPEYLSMSLSSLREKHEELKRLAPNAKYFAQKCAQLMEKVSDLDEQINSLEDKLKRKDERIEVLRQYVEQVKKEGFVEELVILEVDKNRMGAFVPGHTHLKLVEKYKQLKETYDNEIRIKATAQQQNVGEGI